MSKPRFSLLKPFDRQISLVENAIFLAAATACSVNPFFSASTTKHFQLLRFSKM